MSNTSTVIYQGGNMQRVVRSQRMFKGVRVGAIKDKGYLVLVRFDGFEGVEHGGMWTMCGTIRKLKCA